MKENKDIGMDSLDNLVLGKSPELIELHASEQNLAATTVLVRQATRSVEIVSRQLESAVYDQAELLAAVRRLVLDHRRARVRILVSDPEPLIKDGHRLLALALRLSSFMEIRVLCPEDQDFNQAFLIADQTGYIRRELADRYEGVACFNDRAKAGEMARLFNQLWEPAIQDPNLRQVRL